MTGLLVPRRHRDRSRNHHVDVGALHVARARSLDYQHVVEVAARPNIRSTALSVPFRETSISVDAGSLVEAGLLWS